MHPAGRNHPYGTEKQDRDADKFRLDELEFCLCQAPLGASAATQLLDFLIACGCRKIISAGSCGVLTAFSGKHAIW